MMESQVNKFKNINIFLILIYFVATILVMFQVNLTGKVALGTVVIIFTLFLIYISAKDLKNKDKYKEPLYYYFFVLIVIATVYYSGYANSILFPSIFIIPFLHSVINFTRRESIGVTLFILASMWLILMGDMYLIKIYRLVFVSIGIVFTQVILELLKKEHKVNKKKVMNKTIVSASLDRVCINADKE